MLQRAPIGRSLCELRTNSPPRWGGEFPPLEPAGTQVRAWAFISSFWLRWPALAFLFGTLSPDRNSRELSYFRGDPLCNDGSKVSEAGFYSEISRANARMHAGMEIAPSGDTDRDFARFMIAHHQGAIDMALVQLKCGGDARLKRLAQSILVEQGKEITYMRNLLDREQIVEGR